MMMMMITKSLSYGTTGCTLRYSSRLREVADPEHRASEGSEEGLGCR